MLVILLSLAIQVPVDVYGKLKVSGNKIVGSNGAPAVLHGVSLAWHNWWSQFYTASNVAYLASEWKVSLLRAAIGVEPEGAYLDDPDLGDKSATTVADAAIKAGIYVILDFHQHKINQDAAVKFFTKFAQKYSGVPNVIYELFNEPESATWPEVKAYAEVVIKVIHSFDPDALILVGCPQWDQKIEEPADSPITGYSNIAYTLHFYAGTHTQWLRDSGHNAINKGIAVFASEIGGMDASGDGPIATSEWNLWISWLKAHDISWAAWSISNKQETCSMVLPTSSANSPWGDNQLNEWGRLVRDLLISIA
uniref:Putative glycosyl hydrolase family5 n=1 Tax=uncultured symbiotic protist of Cryptocercus punctulatus TaxID=403662 RepID=A4UX48_9EUKA|nr:putative glycosyl hydrolase family5 [uncultured symbiotic protist of Cryptocercus punctulatus]